MLVYTSALFFAEDLRSQGYKVGQNSRPEIIDTEQAPDHLVLMIPIIPFSWSNCLLTAQ